MELCYILFSPIYTANCELDETVVLRMTASSNGHDIDPARNTFTIKILETLDDTARIPNGHLYSVSAYARERCTADGINWKRNNTPLNQGDSLESQDDQHSLQSEEGNDQQQADYSELKAQVRTWAGETQHGQAHVERWLRVLHTFRGTANDATVMTAAGAREQNKTTLLFCDNEKLHGWSFSENTQGSSDQVRASLRHREVPLNSMGEGKRFRSAASSVAYLRHL